MEPQEGSIRLTTGVELRYQDWNRPAGAPLVLLHGILGNSWEWESVARTVSRQRRVIVPDQRGHGASGWGEGYTADHLVADLASLVDEFGLDGFDLAGHSMGGIVAMLYAARHRERVRHLALLDIGPDSLEDRETREGLLAMLDEFAAASYGDVQELVDAWRQADPLAGPGETRRWAERSLCAGPDGRWVWRIDAARIGDFLRERVDEELLWSALGRITAPTLVVRGEQSWALSPATAQRMADELARGHLALVPGAGHDLGVQAPHDVARLLVEDVDAEPGDYAGALPV